MPVVNIIFQQNNDNNTTPGSRDDLVLNLPVTVLNQDATGITSYLWQFVDIPAGSAAVLDSASNSVVHFTPDIVGTYLIKLIVNSSIIGTSAAAIKTSNLHMRLPAAGEIIEFGSKGWSRALEAALKVIDDGYGNHQTSFVELSPLSQQIGSINISSSIRASSGIFTGHIQFDGYTLDISGGVSSGQALVFNGASFVPTDVSAGIPPYNGQTVDSTTWVTLVTIPLLPNQGVLVEPQIFAARTDSTEGANGVGNISGLYPTALFRRVGSAAPANDAAWYTFVGTGDATGSGVVTPSFSHPPIIGVTNMTSIATQVIASGNNVLIQIRGQNGLSLPMTIAWSMLPNGYEYFSMV